MAGILKNWGVSRAVVGVVLLSAFTLSAQDPIPPPTTPNTIVGQYNSLQVTLLAKATPDECWKALGQNTPFDFINQANPVQPCPAGQIPKVNQGYIWGGTQVGNLVLFGTLANGQCVTEGLLLNASGTTPTPYETATNEFVNSWACEFGVSPYVPSLLPAPLGDYRPPRFYAYNLTDLTIKDITPKLGGAPPGVVCGPLGVNPYCLDSLWLTLLGARAVTSYVDPVTQHTYVLVGGPALVAAANALNFFALDITGVTEPSQITNSNWVGKYEYTGYNDIRRWIPANGVLYAPVGNEISGGGALLQYTGSFAALPPTPVPSILNGFNAIPLCGTNSNTIPPQPSLTFACFAFQDVGNFDGDATDATLHEGRVFVATWPPPSSGSLWMSPPIPAGGFGQPSANPPLWTKVWSIGANYDPDPVVSSTIGTGALADFNGVLYWGTMVVPELTTLAWYETFGPPQTQAAAAIAIANTFRAATLFSGTNFTSGTPQIKLLYGESAFQVWNPTTQQWVMTPNKMGGVTPLFGHSGFGNLFDNYIWTMAVLGSKLYVGTMDWSYLAAVGAPLLVGGPAGSLIAGLIPTQQYGADLFSFADTNSPAVPESIDGLGNSLNYGIRTMIPNGNTSLLIGTADPINLVTTNQTPTHGGWELIQATPGVAANGITLPSNTTVPVGGVAPFQVSLSQPAPAGGVYVTLVSSDPLRVSINPSTVLIPGGWTTNSTTPQLSGNDFGAVTITASAYGYINSIEPVQATDTLTLQPSTLTVNGTGTQFMYATLSGPAPPFGLTVNLTSNNPAVTTVPPSVNILPGATSAGFPVNVISSGSAVITASINIPSIVPATANVVVGSSIAATTGSMQTTMVNTSFGAALVATVSSNGVGISGVPVTFTASTSGPSATFNGSWSVTVPTGPGGQATSPIPFANTVAGTYSIVASALGATAIYSLTNTPGPAANIVATSGSGQSAVITQPFANPLVVTVTDAFLNPVPSTTVTFIPPMSGASGTFTGLNSATTNSSGIAKSPVYTANTIPGLDVVAASTAGVLKPAVFTLINSLPGIQLPFNTQVPLNGSAPFLVTLATPAPFGGLIVTLASSDPTSVTITPSNLLFPAGATSAAVTPNLNGMKLSAVTITASAYGLPPVNGNVLVTATLSFSAPSISIPANSLKQTFLNLSAPAPAGGVTINLSSNNSAVASVPSTVTIPAGATSVGVLITTGVSGMANITASALPNIGPVTLVVNTQ